MLVWLWGLATAAQLSWSEIAKDGLTAQEYHAWGNQLYENQELIGAQIAWQRGLYLAPWSSELRNNLVVTEAQASLIVDPRILIPVFSILLTFYLCMVYTERKKGRSFLWILMLMVALMAVPYLNLINKGQVRVDQKAYTAISGQGTSVDLQQGELVQEIQRYGAEVQIERQDGDKVWISSVNYLPLVHEPFLEKIGKDVK